MATMTVGIVLFGISLMLSWLNSATHVLHAEKLVYTRWITLLGERPSNRRGTVIGVLTLVFIALTVGFCWQPGWTRQLFGWSILGMLLMIRSWEVRQWNREIVVGLGKYVPTAAATLGYLVTAGLVAVLAPSWNADTAGWQAGCGVMAGSWGLAAFAKIRESGFVWASAGNVALLVRERSYMGPASLRRLRRWVSNHVLLCLLASYVGFWGEAAGLLFVVPELRWPAAVASTLFQLGIMLLLGYFELEWIVVMVALAALGGGSL
jgi:hypothetical protein